jgi:hypothetical protein
LTSNPSAFFRSWNVKDSWQKLLAHSRAALENGGPGDTRKIVFWRSRRKPCGSKKAGNGFDLAEA